MSRFNLSPELLRESWAAGQAIALAQAQGAAHDHVVEDRPRLFRNDSETFRKVATRLRERAAEYQRRAERCLMLAEQGEAMADAQDRFEARVTQR